ncbi:MAG: p-cumate dioxygenase [Ramlibacter sp.]|nr:p-cumate dioxygenase [Ramlibacter sp.]
MKYMGGNNIAIDAGRGVFQVARRAFTSEAILQAEREEIFDRCWIYLGHESEVRAPGAFVARSVAGRDVIFNRDAKGVVHAFLDSCPHRGAKLCQERQGIAKNFQCIYHGWVFSADGKFRRQPHHAAYPADFECTGAVDLVAVPRLESYRGLWFVCFDKDAVSLHDYLGGAREYIDCMADQADELEIISGSQEYMIRANWKLLCENSFDGYHADNLHATYFDYVRNVTPNAPKNGPPPKLEGVSRELGNGHAVVEFSAPWGRPAGKWSPAWGEQSRAEMDGIYGKLQSRLGEERARRISHMNRNLVVFPNLVIVDAAGLVIRTMYPDEPGRMSVSSWAVAPKDESAWLRKIRLRNFLEFLGPGGLATPDDIEALERCQRGYRNIKEAGWNDVSKGALDSAELPMEDEGQIRAFWRQWGVRMDGRAGPADPPPPGARQ